MHGPGIGSLKIYRLGENEEISSRSPILTLINGEQGDEWFEQRTNIPGSDSLSKVRLENCYVKLC